jgi:hypothetical protein
MPLNYDDRDGINRRHVLHRMISIGAASVLVVSVEVPFLAFVAAQAAPTAVLSSPAAIVSSPARSAAFPKAIEGAARGVQFVGIGSAADSDAFISMAETETLAVGRREEQGCWEWYCLQSELTPSQGRQVKVRVDASGITWAKITSPKIDLQFGKKNGNKARRLRVLPL